VNFDYLGDDRKTQLLRFFEWFGDRLPRPRGMQTSRRMAAIPADAGNLVPAAASTVSDPDGQAE